MEYNYRDNHCSFMEEENKRRKIMGKHNWYGNMWSEYNLHYIENVYSWHCLCDSKTDVVCFDLLNSKILYGSCLMIKCQIYWKVNSSWCNGLAWWWCTEMLMEVTLTWKITLWTGSWPLVPLKSCKISSASTFSVKSLALSETLHLTYVRM